MTQDVQPLTWQKRTNLEEHQQFFSKINEIIDNLAPTMDEAKAAAATANAASAAASAAASQAQTAASTVAGYDTRLTAAEGGIAALQTADGQNVKISRINEYAVGLTGNQDISGEKTFINSIIRKIGVPGGSSPESYSINIYDWCLLGNDGQKIISCGHGKSNTSNLTTLIFGIFANTDIETNKQPRVEIQYNYDETNKKVTLRLVRVDKNGHNTFGTEQVLMTW